MQAHGSTLNFTGGSVKRPDEILGIEFLWASYEGRAGYHLIPNLFQSIKQVVCRGAELNPSVLLIPQIRG